MSVRSPARAAPADRHRYPGVGAFEEADANCFFGRKRAVEELLLRVLSVRLLLQFAPSGVGKTSLLQAGLFPRLREHDYCPVSVRLNRADERLTAAVRRSLVEAANAAALSEPVIPADAADTPTLLANTELWSPELSKLMPVLVFDQFEEVFTLRDEPFRHELARVIGLLCRTQSGPEGRAATMPLKLIISVREEFLGRLEEFTQEIPHLFDERLRLAPLSHEEAREAMVGPARMAGDAWESPRFEFEPDCLNALLDFIDGTSERHRVIEALTLQLVCRKAEELAMRARGPALSVQRLVDFGGEPGLRRVVADHFAVEVGKLAAADRRRAQAMFEQGLLDPAGKRLMLEEGEIDRRYSLQRAALDRLVDSRLLRREPRNESLFYEISHDRLADAIKRQRRPQLPRWVIPVLGVAAAVFLLVIAVLLAEIRAAQREAEALRRADKAYGLLLGEGVVPRLRDAGAADALQDVLDRIDRGGDDPIVPNESLRLRHQGELLIERGTLQQARDTFKHALSILDSRHDPAQPQPVPVLAERARLHLQTGLVETEAGRFAEADTLFEKAEVLWSGVLERDPKPEDRADAAETAMSRSSLALQQGDLLTAEAHIARGAEIAVQAWLNAHDDAKEGNRNTGFERGRAMQLLADVVLSSAAVWDDEQDYEAAAALGAEALRIRPFSTRAAKVVATLNAMLGRVRGDMGQGTEFEMREAEDQMDRLVRSDPDNSV